MMEYPAELVIGDKANETSDLAKFFKKGGWDYTWDFDRTGYWYEISFNNKMIMQVEFDVPVEEMLKTIKEFVPQFDGMTLNSVFKFVNDYQNSSGNRGGLYIYHDTPKWKELKSV